MLRTASVFLFAACLSMPALATTGGPDGGGYTFIDSDEPGGPAYTWDDISATGTALAMSDDNHLPITSSFGIPFYGTTYTDLAVGSNGTVYFDPANYLGLGNTCPMPGTTSYTPQALVAGYWDDLNPGAGGQVLWQELTAPNRIVVSWLDVPLFGGGGVVTFQVVLFESGNIDLRYQTLTVTGDGASVGIQNDATTGLMFGCNTPALLHDALQISFASTPCDASVDVDADGANQCADCNDSNSAIFPGAVEVAGDGLDNDCDGIDGLTLEVGTLTPGAPATFRVRGAYPGATVGIARSTRGPGSGPCPAALNGQCIDLLSPALLRTGTANGSGVFQFTANLPATLPSGVTAYFQAFDLSQTPAEASAVESEVIQ